MCIVRIPRGKPELNITDHTDNTDQEYILYIYIYIYIYLSRPIQIMSATEEEVEVSTVLVDRRSFIVGWVVISGWWPFVNG